MRIHVLNREGEQMNGGQRCGSRAGATCSGSADGAATVTSLP